VEENEPVYIELADALELYASILVEPPGRPPTSFAIRPSSRVRWGDRAITLHYQDPELADWIMGLRTCFIMT
jgi:hypothetical protein